MAERDAEAGAEKEPTPSRDHGGIVDIGKLPGGNRLVALRADLVERYEPYLELDKDDKETVHRWGLGSIVSHWVLVVCMLLAVVTGVAFWTGWYGPLDVGIWDGYQTAFQLHVWAGVVLAVIALAVFPFYHKVVDGHRLLLSRTQLKENVVIALSFLGFLRYVPGYKQARRTYDEDEREWVGYHPVQTAFWYGMWFFVALLTLTGFALWAALASDPAWWLSALGFAEGWVAYETMLRVHFVAMFGILAMIAAHAYIALLPSNADILGSMITGSLKGWRVDEESRPDAPGEEGGPSEGGDPETNVDAGVTDHGDDDD